MSLEYFTPNSIESTTAGTIPAGNDWVSVLNIGAASGTLLGVELPVNGSLSFPFTTRQWSEMDYDATGTKFLIITAK